MSRVPIYVEVLKYVVLLNRESRRHQISVAVYGKEHEPFDDGVDWPADRLRT